MYITQQLKFYHHWIEYSLLLFFYLQVCIAHGFALLNESEASLRRKTLHIATIFFSFGSLLYVLFLTYHPSTEKYETLQFIFGILQFVPLFSAASLRLKFGKVSLVLTQTIQYLIFFAFCIFVGILVNTLFRYIFAGNPYQHITELVTSIGIVMLGRGIYQANEKLIRKYFILSQQQKDDNLRSFLAQIPQYTSISKLKTETTHQLKTYLETDTIHIAWKGDLDMKTTESLPPSVEALYPLLHESQQIWSKNKELSGFYFPEKEEVLALNYSLIFTLTVNDSNHGLVLFGKKRSGVYNLSDLEIIGQTLQQVRLTLSVLQFLQREKELLEQTFQANLTALRSQINPHFLFNTLNTISALIHESPDLAEEAVEKLAFIFRYTLKVSNQNFVSLDSEMQLVKTYLDIEKIRFGARLDISIDIDEDCGSIEIPAFVLQTLAENCIKHGIAKIVDKGIISFSAFIENHCLKIEIYDNGPGIIAGRERKGTGLNNIIARLENIYHLSSVIKFENTGNGTLVSLSIPVPPKLS